MNIDFILPLSLVLALITWTLIFAWYINPVFQRLPLERALEPILLLHSFRYVGLMFLVPGVTAEVLDPRFALPAAYGDLAAALLALLAIVALRLQLSWRIEAVWLFNLWGAIDLINAVARGILYTPDGHLGATFWIPATIVPLLFVTHGYVFIQLLKYHRPTAASPGI